MREPDPTSNLVAWRNLNLPVKIRQAEEFERSVLVIREAYTRIRGDDEHFLNLMYYLLGWLVGDAGKGFSRKVLFKVRVEIGLCKKHSQNPKLGQYVIDSLIQLGVMGNRIADGLQTPREPHGSYRWQSHFSTIVAWLYTACVGLEREQRTTHDPVQMEWILSAGRGHLISIMRGIADSDGSVNVRNRSVVITSSPNTLFFKSILRKLGIRVGSWFSGGVGYVSVRAKDAYEFGIFNPEVSTHRECFFRNWPRPRLSLVTGHNGSRPK